MISRGSAPRAPKTVWGSCGPAHPAKAEPDGIRGQGVVSLMGSALNRRSVWLRRALIEGGHERGDRGHAGPGYPGKPTFAVPRREHEEDEQQNRSESQSAIGARRPLQSRFDQPADDRANDNDHAVDDRRDRKPRQREEHHGQSEIRRPSAPGCLRVLHQFRIAPIPHARNGVKCGQPAPRQVRSKVLLNSRDPTSAFPDRPRRPGA